MCWPLSVQRPSAQQNFNSSKFQFFSYPPGLSDKDKETKTPAWPGLEHQAPARSNNSWCVLGERKDCLLEGTSHLQRFYSSNYMLQWKQHFFHSWAQCLTFREDILMGKATFTNMPIFVCPQQSSFLFSLTQLSTSPFQKWDTVLLFFSHWACDKGRMCLSHPFSPFWNEIQKGPTPCHHCNRTKLLVWPLWHWSPWANLPFADVLAAERAELFHTSRMDGQDTCVFLFSPAEILLCWWVSSRQIYSLGRRQIFFHRDPGSPFCWRK